MIKSGFIDPRLVTRTAVQNAACVAGLLLTTEAVISDKPERLVTISLGHDEILFGITDSAQIDASTSFAQEEGSNIKSKSEGLPGAVLF